ncbi:hypothetical protein ASG01_04590 [Chryseobacterium sp. Leaf180]|uniref:hypothetical protein n=1 Tax=Chryseobacterium sp. Leaf180 TaxID=1736289 RepID=UPI0006F8E12F|nr:hypothetical protein [Chryseobacterium sp. Leaf180]KQR95135.1 hypothetical protein ASG01_04590 [Chryseobacterium sp. Leaf180]
MKITKKPWVKKLLIGLGIFFGIVLIANFALNLWLKNRLPVYIKNNTDYLVSYKTLGVDLGTGNVFATQISVKTKNPENDKIIGFRGTIDTLKVSRFGIYDAVVNKVIHSSDILLARPNLQITLAKPKDKKAPKKRNPVAFDNIKIINGSIRILKSDHSPYFAADDLNLSVDELSLPEEPTENDLPLLFDSYSISTRNFYFRPNEVYAITVKKMATANGKLSAENVVVKPLVSFDDFKRKFPKKKQLYAMTLQKMVFQDMILKKNKVTLTNAFFQNPQLEISTTDAVPDQLKKPFNFEVNLDNIKIANAKILIKKPNGEKLLDAPLLNASINAFKIDKNSSQEIIPVQYKDFNISGSRLHFFTHQDFGIGKFSLTEKKGEFTDISSEPISENSEKTSMGLKGGKIAFNLNTFEVVDKKIKLDVQNLLLENINGNIIAGITKPKSKKRAESLLFPVKIHQVDLKNSSIEYISKNQPLSFSNLNAQLNNAEITENSSKDGIAFSVKNYSLKAKDFAYKTEFYLMKGQALSFTEKNFSLANFSMKPLVSRNAFIKMIDTEKDLYDISVKQVSAQGNWDFLSEEKSIFASKMTVEGADANIFRSKVPDDDPKKKPLYSKMLREIKIPMLINLVQLKNSVLVYEEDTPKSDGPGKLTFTNFNMAVTNLNSAKMKNKPTRVGIKINCIFMKTSPLNVNWDFDTADRSDRFSIGGKLSNIPAVALNSFVVPYMSVTATGTINEMLFNFKGNPKGIGGPFSIKHKDLKITVLKKETKEKKGILSAVANLFIKSDSDKFPEAVVVEDVDRDPTKSFFNLFWKGIEDGLKRTLIGIKLEPTKTVPVEAAKVKKK